MVGSEKLLPEADQQERGKNSRDQSEKGMGEYFFVDPSERIRNVSRERMCNGRLKEKVETGQNENRYAAQAGRSQNSWFG